MPPKQKGTAVVDLSDSNLQGDTQDLNFINIRPVSSQAFIPKRGTSGAAGRDLFVTHNITFAPGTIPVRVVLDLEITQTNIYSNCYLRVAERSSIAALGLHLQTCVVPVAGNLTLFFINLTNEPINILRGTGIAQLIIHEIKPLWATILLPIYPDDSDMEGAKNLQMTIADINKVVFCWWKISDQAKPLTVSVTNRNFLVIKAAKTETLYPKTTTLVDTQIGISNIIKGAYVRLMLR